MESVLAVAVLRNAACAIRSGQDADTALSEASRGFSKSVHELVLAHIHQAISKKGKVTPEKVRDAILTAEGALQ